MTISAYPLQWPAGWKRMPPSLRKSASFSTQRYSGVRQSQSLTVADGVERVMKALSMMNVPDYNIIISTNVQTKNNGFPRSGQAEPDDPGAAVYFRGRNTDESARRCMAIDRYTRVADNLAAIAATLDAMRAIERHGGAEILDRAFTGFAALTGPESKAWHVVLGCPAHASTEHVTQNYKRARSEFHPDKGGDAETFGAIQSAWKAFCAERGLTP